jgi:hypothetical protein
LTSNSVAGTFDRGFLSFSVSSQVWYVGVFGDECYHSLLDNFQGVGLECLSSDFPCFGGPSGAVGISHVVPPGD